MIILSLEEMIILSLEEMIILSLEEMITLSLEEMIIFNISLEEMKDCPSGGTRNHHRHLLKEMISISLQSVINLQSIFSQPSRCPSIPSVHSSYLKEMIVIPKASRMQTSLASSSPQSSKHEENSPIPKIDPNP